VSFRDKERNLNTELGSKDSGSGGFDLRFLNQQDRDVILYWIHASAFGTTERFRSGAIFERLFTRRANQKIE